MNRVFVLSSTHQPLMPCHPARARYLWAMLLARLIVSFPLVCPHCGADMRIVAFITEASPVQRILARIGEPALRRRSRGPPRRG